MGGGALGLSRALSGSTAVTLTPEPSVQAVFGSEAGQFQVSIAWWLAITLLAWWVLTRTRPYSTVMDGPLHVVSPVSVDRVRRQQVHGPDEALVDQPTRFGTVFGLSSPRQPMLGTGSFGHDGLGGHLTFAHPESGIAFAFLTNRAVPDPTPHTLLWRWPRRCDECAVPWVRSSTPDRAEGGPS